MTKYLQNRIAQSRWALSFVAAYTLVVCVASGLIVRQLWIQLALLAVSALMMVELNNSNALIRIYSRMVSCSFLVMGTMATFLFQNWETMLLCFSTVSFYLSFFKAYQNPSAAGHVFYAFCAIGLASTVWVHVLFLMPILWILLATNVLAFSGRTFFASLLGIVAPYWFIGSYMVVTGQLDYFQEHFFPLLLLSNPLEAIPHDPARLITAGFILAVASLSSIHFLIYSYLDKIRTRMVYETFITIDTVLFVFMVLQPQHFDALLSLIIVTTAPIAGHYLALSHTKLSNITFITTIILALILTAYNIWIFSPIFS